LNPNHRVAGEDAAVPRSKMNGERSENPNQGAQLILHADTNAGPNSKGRHDIDGSIEIEERLEPFLAKVPAVTRGE
jgi:hypothetical protein